MGTLSVDVKTSTGSVGRRRLLIPGAAAVVIAAVGWMALLFLERSVPAECRAADYPTPRTIQYSYTLQNRTNRVIEKAEFWAQAPVKQTASQRCEDLSANYPFQLISDPSGNQALHFTFEHLAPYATRIVTIKASLRVSSAANPLAAGPGSDDLDPETYIESDHPAIRRAAAELRQADAIETIKAVFERVASTVRYSGYAARERGALFAFQQKSGDCTEFMDRKKARASEMPGL